jgi:MscS family membrane protein
MALSSSHGRARRPSSTGTQANKNMIWTHFFLAIVAADQEAAPAPLSKDAQKVAEVISKQEEQLPATWRQLIEVPIVGNEVWRYLFLIASVLIFLAVGRAARLALEVAANRFEKKRRDLFAAMCRAMGKATGLCSLLLGIQVGINFLKIGDATADTIGGVLFTLAVGYVCYCLVAVIDHWLRSLSSVAASQLDQMLVPLVSACLRLTVVALVVVQISTYYKPMTSLIAGLGVGGLAIGLAAQDTIKNFFGSLMIFSDRPFELGEEIRVDTIGGVVESVGFRSTRLRTAEGFLVTISNGELASKTIVNLSKRPSLFRQFTLPLSYDLAPEKLTRASEIVVELLRNHEGSRAANPPRVFVADFTPSAINLAISYWYFPADWWRFMAFNQRTNLEILRRFAAEEIRLAYPTQAIRLTQEATAQAVAESEPAESQEPGPADPRRLA